MALGVRPPMRQALGWRELADAVRRAPEWSPRAQDPPVVADSFATMFCVGFHLRRTASMYTLEHRRNVQYGMVGKLAEWGADESAFLEAMPHHNGPVLYAHNHRASGKRLRQPDPARMQGLFAWVERLETVTIGEAPRVHCCYSLYRCTGWRGPAGSPRRAESADD
jgi:hypothetical protein